LAGWNFETLRIGILAGFVDGRPHRPLLGLGYGSAMMCLPGLSSSSFHFSTAYAISASR
jgi:hypothetical protein